MALTARPTPPHDWTYRAARHRLICAGQAQLPKHAATARMDEQGNRIVDCACGWSGNGLGWANHLDSVVHQALEALSA
jgi:hypothetical protein